MVMTTDQPIRCETIRVLGTLEATVYARKIIIAEGGAVIGSAPNEAEVPRRVPMADAGEGQGEFLSALKDQRQDSRAGDLAISAESNTDGADIKRVVPRILKTTKAARRRRASRTVIPPCTSPSRKSPRCRAVGRETAQPAILTARSPVAQRV